MESEHARSRRAVADLTLDNQILKEAERGWADGVWGKEAEAGAGLGSLRWRSCTTGGASY